MFEMAVIEQAKGVLMLRYGIGSYEALAVLGRWSQESGVALGDLSRAITHGVCQGHTGAGSVSAALVRWLEQRLREDLTEPSLTEAVTLRG
ncbi:MAG TPA: ANTAR domain-containing protein [Nocardioidaceae bacterium]|nr:ANTAR domain-containing protein [Nocardioidaceae bacterium]